MLIASSLSLLPGPLKGQMAWTLLNIRFLISYIIFAVRARVLQKVWEREKIIQFFTPPKITFHSSLHF